MANPANHLQKELKIPNIKKVGFIANIPKDKIKKGDYEVSLYVVSSDRKSYYETDDKIKIKIR